MSRIFRSILCALLIAAVALPCAMAEVDLGIEAHIDAPVDGIKTDIVIDLDESYDLDVPELVTEDVKPAGNETNEGEQASEDFEIFEGGILGSYRGKASEVVIPDEVTEIGAEAFSDCTTLTKVVIGPNVTRIRANAFIRCVNLVEVFIPDSVTRIDEGTFCGCTSLKTIAIPESVTIIEPHVFAELMMDYSDEGVYEYIGLLDITIYGKTGSAAQIYAQNAGIPFVDPVQAKPDSVSLNKRKATVYAGKTLQLKATVKPAGVSTTLKWRTSNSKVATVTQKGLVKAVGKGTATITVKTDNGKKATCKITVPTAPRKIAFARTICSVKKGKTIKLTAKLTPTRAKTTLTWTTSDKKVATVTQKGVVKGVKKGTATITVKTANGKKASVKVVVK